MLSLIHFNQSVALPRFIKAQFSSYYPGEKIQFIHVLVKTQKRKPFIFVADFYDSIVATDIKNNGKYSENQILILKGTLDKRNHLHVTEIDAFPYFFAKKMVSLIALAFMVWKVVSSIKVTGDGLILKIEAK